MDWVERINRAILIPAALAATYVIGIIFITPSEAAGHEKGTVLVYSDLSTERAVAHEILQRLLAVSTIQEPVELEFVDEEKEALPTIIAFGGRGCYIKVFREDQEILTYLRPEISITLGTLEADKKQVIPKFTLFLLAHELAHIEKIVALVPRPFCDDYYKRVRNSAEIESEEREADRRAVILLTHMGYNGRAISEEVVTVLCLGDRKMTWGCSAPHPTLRARLKAIREAISVNE